MSTRLADLTQYWQYVTGLKFEETGPYIRFGGGPAPAVDPEFNKAVFDDGKGGNAPMFTGSTGGRGGLSHSNLDKCPDNCEMKDLCAYSRRLHSKPLATTVPAADNEPRLFTPNEIVQLCDDVRSGLERDGKLTATVPTDKLFRKCSHCNGPLPPIEPMTLERAVAVLNEHKYLNRRWVLSDLKAEWQDGAISVPRHFDDPSASSGITQCFDKFQTIAIAEALLKSPDTAL